MSAHAYGPLRAVPTPPTTSERLAAEIVRRRRLQRAWDALRAAPAKAAGYAARLADALHLTRPAGWLRWHAARLWRSLAVLPARLGRSGMAAAAVVVVTSPAGQAVIRHGASLLSRAVRWAGRTAHGTVRAALRLLGTTGEKAADTLDRWVDRLVSRSGAVLASGARQLARWTDPASALIRALASISRGFLLHRVLRLVVANPYVRLLVEGLVGLITVDSRPLVWLRRQLAALRLRLGRPAATADPRPGRLTPKRPARRQRLSPRDEQALEDEQLTMPNWEAATKAPETDEDDAEQPPLPRAWQQGRTAAAGPSAATATAPPAEPAVEPPIHRAGPSEHSGRPGPCHPS